MKIKNVRPHLVHRLTRLRSFFDENVTGYTYFFFAQALFIAEHIFWQYQLKGSFGKTPFYSFAGRYAVFTMLVYYSFPFLFAIAAFLTFRYPKDFTSRVFFIFMNSTLSLIVYCSTLLS